jgi:hypothetical protein
MLEELAAEFGLRTQEAINRLQALEQMGRVTGVFDDRGKFIYIAPHEMDAVSQACVCICIFMCVCVVTLSCSVHARHHPSSWLWMSIVSDGWLVGWLNWLVENDKVVPAQAKANETQLKAPSSCE